MDESTLNLDSGCIVKNKWKLGEKIAAGGFGSIFEAHDIKTKEVYALKTEKKAVKDYLKIESDVYHLVEGKCGFPKFFWSGKTTYTDEKSEKHNCRVLVMEILGSSLSDLFYQMGKKFSLKTTLLIGIQMIDRLADLHSVGIVHRDIKPGNFVMGKGENAHVVYLLDFGLSHSFRDANTKDHIPYQEGVAFRGTHRYASINSHLRVEQSRRDDLEALGYVLIYFMKGLPWANLNVERKDRRKVIGEAKAKCSKLSLTEGLPNEFITYLDYTQALRFDEEPDYEKLKRLFADCLTKENLPIDTVYDWTVGAPKPLAHPKPVDAPPPKRRKLMTGGENPTNGRKRKVPTQSSSLRGVSEDDDDSEYEPTRRKPVTRSSRKKPKIIEISDED